MVALIPPDMQVGAEEEQGVEEQEEQEASREAGAGVEPEEGLERVEVEAHAVVTMAAVLEMAAWDAAPAMTRQGFCPMLAPGAITGKRQHTSTWGKVRETLKWSRCQPISGATFACASFRSCCSCYWCPSSCTCCRS